MDMVLIVLQKQYHQINNYLPLLRITINHLSSDIMQDGVAINVDKYKPPSYIASPVSKFSVSQLVEQTKKSNHNDPHTTSKNKFIKFVCINVLQKSEGIYPMLQAKIKVIRHSDDVTAYCSKNNYNTIPPK